MLKARRVTGPAEARSSVVFSERKKANSLE